MEENKEINEIEEIGEEEVNAQVLKKESYQPRPKWQIVAAWIGVVIVAVAFALYCYQIANGGK